MCVCEFIQQLYEKCDSCTSHHFTARAQAIYLKELKEKLPLQEQTIILIDFVENCSFLYQAAVQEVSLGYISGYMASCSGVL